VSYGLKIFLLLLGGLAASWAVLVLFILSILGSHYAPLLLLALLALLLAAGLLFRETNR
jgi:hypothetical protein